MSDPTEFLLARYAEEEADLRESRIEDMPEWWAPDAWSRERGLMEVAAKRRIVEDIIENDYYPSSGVTDGLAARVLEYLTAAYSDHPDYDDEWRP